MSEEMVSVGSVGLGGGHVAPATEKADGVDGVCRPDAVRSRSATVGRDLKLAIGRGPICPHCRCNTFDDWHHARTLRAGFGIASVEGSLKCHGCGKFFSITVYYDSECHSTAWTKRPVARPPTPTLESADDTHTRDDVVLGGRVGAP